MNSFLTEAIIYVIVRIQKMNRLRRLDFKGDCVHEYHNT